MNDFFELKRFVDAQATTYTQALAELRAGLKTGHWIWFIFPQIRGLGLSAMSVRYAIASLDEAEAYLAHLVLGARLIECTNAVLADTSLSVEQIFGNLDAMKFRSSMTLFASVPSGSPVFRTALDRFFGGQPDPSTQALLKRA